MKINISNYSHYKIVLLMAIALILFIGTLYIWKGENNASVKNLVSIQERVVSTELWVEPITKLMWTRCTLGQKLEINKTKAICQGQVQTFSWEDAKNIVVRLNQESYLGYNDWRLPNIAELSGIISCENGFLYQTIVTNLDKNVSVNVGCAGKNYKRPTLNHDIFPNAYSAWYWSSTPYIQSSGESLTAWGVYLSSGYSYDLSKSTAGYILLVR